MTTRFRRLHLVAAIALASTSACSRNAPHGEVEYFGSVDVLRGRAEVLGCHFIETNYRFPGAFSCITKIQPCGCTLTIDVSTTKHKVYPWEDTVDLVDLRLDGCPADVGRDQILSFVDPLIHEDRRSAFNDLVTKPLIQRDADQQRHKSVVQSGVFGDAHVQVEFGVVAEVIRTQVHIDRFTELKPAKLVDDVRGYVLPCDAVGRTIDPH